MITIVRYYSDLLQSLPAYSRFVSELLNRTIIQRSTVIVHIIKRYVEIVLNISSLKFILPPERLRNL